MGKIYRAENPAEALEMALRFQRSKKYDLFRGQTKDWPLTPSRGRLMPDELEANRDRLLSLQLFLSQYEQAKQYSEHPDILFAVAQHYGIATDLLDFTRSPIVALFFATHSKQSLAGKEGVIICLDKKDFKEFVTFRKDYCDRREIVSPEIIEPRIDNLWRLKSQMGCFMRSNFIGLERFYSFDKILFSHADDCNFIDESKIYPEKKSDLEILLDNYFAAERIDEGTKRLQHFARVMNIPVRKIKSDKPYKYVKSAEPHGSWSDRNRSKWAYKITEPLHRKAAVEFELTVKSSGSFDEDFSRIRKRLILLFEDKNITKRDFVAPAIRFVPQVRSKRSSLQINGKVRQIWEGMRTLPYTKRQIIDAIAKYVTFELYHTAKRIPIETCFRTPILVAASNSLGAHFRFYLSEFLLEQAFRDDILDVQVDSLPKSVSSKLLLYEQTVRILFDFDRLRSLFVKEIIPSMMLSNNPDRPLLLFSPVYMDRLGYA